MELEEAGGGTRRERVRDRDREKRGSTSSGADVNECVKHRHADTHNKSFRAFLRLQRSMMFLYYYIHNHTFFSFFFPSKSFNVWLLVLKKCFVF